MADAQEKRLAHGEVGSVLGLMYTSPERFTSVSGELSAWTDLSLLDESQQAWRDRERSKGSLIAPIGGSGPGGKPLGLVSDTVQYSCVKQSPREMGRPGLHVGVSSDGVPVPGSGTLRVEEMLQPISLLSDATFSVTGNRLVAGRRGIEVRALRRRQWHECSDQPLWEGPDEFHLVVDAERGILLSATSRFQGRPIAGKEFVSVAFGEPLPTDNARLESISEVAALLYSAQFSFASVRATVREWWSETNGRRYRMTATNPPRFRQQAIMEDGQPGNVSAYDGGVWWHYNRDGASAMTNVPRSSLPPGVNVKYHPIPITPGDDVYQILDAEYAIIEQRSLNPSCLLSTWWLEPLERTGFLGREAIRVRGENNPNNGRRYWWDHIEECELLVDAERGTLLRLAGIVDGREVIGHEVTEIEFDEPVDDDEFRFAPPPGASVELAWWSDRPLPPPPGSGPFGVLGQWRESRPSRDDRPS